MTEWIALLVVSVATGVATVLLLVCPRPLHVPVFLGLGIGIAGVLASVGAIVAGDGGITASVAALVFAVAGLAGGYWTSSASLMLLTERRSSRPGTAPRDTPRRVADATVVLLSHAEPERYSPVATARALGRLLETGALQLPTGAIPFVFLADKTRYRHVREQLPARAAAHAVAEALDERLRGEEAWPVSLAWTDSDPSLLEVLGRIANEGGARAIIAVLGEDGTLVPDTVLREAEERYCAPDSPLSVCIAPSIWRSEHLAERLCARILEMTHGVSLGKLGVALIATGQPDEWSDLHRSWPATETYFLQRVRMLLTSAGLDSLAIRVGWLEWQTPDVTETVRHLAATGCERIVVVPATMTCATLGTMVDMEHLIASARVPESVHVVVLGPWNDDPAIVDALADAVRAAASDRR